MPEAGASAAAQGRLMLGHPAIVDDPYPYYASLREPGVPVFDAQLDAWLVARHDDVVEALRDPRLVVGRNAGFLDLLPAELADEFTLLSQFFRTWLSYVDPPMHTRIRSPWASVLTPRSAGGLRDTVEQVVGHLADKVALLGRCQVLEDFGSMPALVLSTFLGLEYAQMSAFKPWIDDIGRFSTFPSVETARRAQESVRQWRSWMLDYLKDPSSRPAGGVLAALADAPDGPAHEDLFAMVASLVTGPPSRERGTNEPTVGFLAKALYVLSQHPDILTRIVDDPGLVPAATEELLRFEPPFHFVARRAAEPMEFRGVRVDSGQRLLLLIASANRDPSQFPSPDELVLNRRSSGNLAFGYGPHYCLGAPLARLEIEVALTTILKRFPDFRVVDLPVRWRVEGGFRGLETLSLRLDGDDQQRLLLDRIEALSQESVAAELADRRSR